MNPNNHTIKQIDPPIRQSYAELFAKMEIGQGFDVTGRNIASVRASACTYKKKHSEWAYLTFKTETGYSIVRIERN
jgi:hypothetical protein